MANPNEELLQKGFDAFLRGDMDKLRNEVFPNFAWHFPGQSAIASDQLLTRDVINTFAKQEMR